ncbi:MAG: hypothetical protein GF393_04040 [Armatimonadia bacterium]|nr:hypothetical protein [Armatimonadia bacterium]
MSAPDRTKPVDLATRREQRRKQLPEALSREQLRRRAVNIMRHNLASLAEDKYEDAKRWLDQIEIIEGPKAAFDSYLRLLEFAVPKLSRAEVSVEDGGSTATREMSMDELHALVMEGVRAQSEDARTIDGETDEPHED